MGVPKFYRWISERYPCLSEVVKEFQLPEFDNLYLDMNGIIHVCSHPDDNNPHFRITEEQIFLDICRYIEFLFRMIKPKKAFFMAVDGVAPRAKMNQQRGRRFRSAREAEELIEKAKKAGEVLPTEKRFDSNCITPGTPFMVRLQQHLKYFVSDKISRDPLWQDVTVYLSGHETPGEGEHKVMDYIRWAKSQPGHDGNTRHCLYGLDADLIMLGLTSHEPHFSLLREEVVFGRKGSSKRPASADETTFHLLHLSMLRDYLAYEFSSVKDKLPFEWDLERIIDDWILMGFLVGNDFVPHLPHFHIKDDALPSLWESYMKVLPKLGGYINEGGYINLPRLERYFRELAKHDRKEFEHAFSDLEFLESKIGGKCINESAGAAAALAKSQLTSGGAGNADFDDESEEEEGFVEAEFIQHKQNYYQTKLDLPSVDRKQMQGLAEGYVRAIQWILLYYFEGVPSWSWYYPHHYAPYISDIQGFTDMKMDFDLATPFLPFEQLMAVLPAASKELLPQAFQPLMTEPSSPVIRFYPVDFTSDLNGKQQSWEAVVLIPFIDEEKLLSAMKTRESLLTREERSRNTHGPHLMYKYTPNNLGFFPSTLPGTCPDIHINRAECTHIEQRFFRIESRLLKKGVADNVDLNIYYPGFPTLRHIPHTHGRKSVGVKVFQQNSRGRSVVLIVDKKPEIRLEELADEILGKTIFVGWPHLHEARVTSLANESFRIELQVEAGKKGGGASVSFNRRKLGDLERSTVASEANAIKEKQFSRYAIDVGDTEIMVYASPMTGRTYTYGNTGTITLDKQFASQPVPFVYQLTVKTLQIKETAYMALQTLGDIFPADATIFMLGTPHYGALGKVLEVLPDSARVRIALEVPTEPDLQSLGLMHMNDRYMTAFQASKMIGIGTQIVSRITGSVFVDKKPQHGQHGGSKPSMNNKVNLGLNLKFTKRELEVPGYTKKEPNGWTYSKQCVEAIGLYINKFPTLWQRINSSKNPTDMFREEDLFPEDGPYTLSEVSDFLKGLPSATIERVKCGTEMLDEEQVARLECVIDNISGKPVTVKMKIKPRLLFRPLTDLGSIVPDPNTDFLLYDRIVVVKTGYSVPFGKRGTIIGIPVEEGGVLLPHTVYDVVFDEPFPGGVALRCTAGKGYKVPGSAMLNITYGEFRKDRPVSDRPTVGVWNKGRPSKNAGISNGAQQDRPGAGASQQPVRWDSKRQPLFGQVFVGNGNSGGSPSLVKPEFVTPKVTAPQSFLGCKSNMKTESVDFNSLWKNLQREKDMKSSGSPSQELTMPVSENKTVPVKILTKPQTSGNQPTTGQSQPSPIPLVQSLFASPGKLAQAGPKAAPTSTENAEFMAMFNSLKLQSEELQQKSKTANASSKDSHAANGANGMPGMLTVEDLEKMEETKKEKIESEDKRQDADNAIKQMLKIGTAPTKSPSPSLSPRLLATNTSSTSSPPPSALVPPPPSASASYGRQVSLQDLFDQANRQLKTQPKEEPNKKEQVPQIEKKEPVKELEEFCAFNGLTPPSYEFRHPGNQTMFIANVLIHTRGRYEGSVCPDKMEAAQSAASIALLCLKSNPQQPTMKAPLIPSAPRPGLIQPVFSHNSAFSPIGLAVQPPRGQVPPPQFSPQQPDLMRPPPLLTPRHFTTQLPPPSLPHPPHPQSNPMMEQLHRQLQQLANQFHRQQQQAQSMPVPPFQVGNINRHQAPPMQQQLHHHHQQQQQQYQQQSKEMPHSSSVSEKGNVPPSPQSAQSQPFIPLQVTRNQSMPKSKKEEDHRAIVLDVGSIHTAQKDKMDLTASKSQNNNNQAPPSPRDPGCPAEASSRNGVQKVELNNASKANSHVPASTSVDYVAKKDKPAAMQKKKSRLAANFSKMTPSGSPSLSQTK